MRNSGYAIEVKRYLDENQVDMFHVNEIYQEFSDFDKRRLKWAIQNVTNLEYSRIENGKYCRNTYRNEYVIGNFLTTDAVIAYWSALNIHGLTEQFPNKVYVQTTKNKIDREIFGVKYQFVKVRSDKMTGIEKTGIGTNQFRITDIEKTIVDCFDLVQYSGGFMELIRAFKRTNLNNKKLITYSKAIGNKAAVKRMGFLSELLKTKGMKQFIEFAKKYKSNNYDLFDKQGYDEGVLIIGWKLKLNMEKEEIIHIANSIY